MQYFLRKLTLSLLTMLVAFASSAAFADCINETNNRVSCTGVVKTVSQNDITGIIFVLYGAVVTAPNCFQHSNAAPGWWILKKSAVSYKQWSQLVLLSAVTGLELHVVSNTASVIGGSCTLERIELRS